MKMISIRLCVVFILLCTLIGGVGKAETPVKKEDGMYATLETNKGDMIIKFTFKKTPLTVCNFVGLAEGTIENDPCDPGEPYYDGLIWHRVVSDRVIQSGCPYGTGNGGPGFELPTEIDPTLIHDRRGAVGMALSSPGSATAGSQFYITHLPLPELDGYYTIFGYVEDSASLEIIMDIRKDDDLNKVTIERIGDEALAFKTDQAAWDSLYDWVTGINPDYIQSANSNPVIVKTNHSTISCIFLQPGIVDIGIYTLSGRRLFFVTRKRVSQGSFAIPYSFKPGMYIVNVKRKETITKKVLIAK